MYALYDAGEAEFAPSGVAELSPSTRWRFRPGSTAIIQLRFVEAQTFGQGFQGDGAVLIAKVSCRCVQGHYKRPRRVPEPPIGLRESPTAGRLRAIQADHGGVMLAQGLPLDHISAGRSADRRNAAVRGD
jgi:hypothetical protein